MKKLFCPCLCLVILAAAGCGRTLIQSQSDPALSAVTAYVDLLPLVLEAVEITDQRSGNVYENKRDGGGKEFFPEEKQSAYVSVGNLPAGEYRLSRIKGWAVFEGESSSRSEFYVDLPSDLLTFTVGKGDIFYLGDIKVIIFKNEESLKAFGVMAAESRRNNEKLMYRTFHSCLTGYNKLQGVKSEFDFGLVYAEYPEPGNDRFPRKGEKEFL
ncbi:MAG: hypothetical protein ACRCUT_01725, partial [Spirochaetota bacterium]